MSSDTASYKKFAANAAVEFVKPGMIVGLGHGSTVQYALNAISSKLRSGELSNITGIACSLQTEAIAKELAIPLGSINDHPEIHVTIDGADEVDEVLNLIKGAGGALLREKIVAQASLREIIIVDEGKLSTQLGTNFPLPVEVSQFGWLGQIDYLKGLGVDPALRQKSDGEPVLTDQGNYLIDCAFKGIKNVNELASQLERRSGILEHGLFIGLATDVLVAGPEGLKHLKAD